MGILTKTRKTRLSIVKRFFAKQHYQWGKVQTFAGRLRVNIVILGSWTHAELFRKMTDTFILEVGWTRELVRLKALCPSFHRNFCLSS